MISRARVTLLAAAMFASACGTSSAGGQDCTDKDGDGVGGDVGCSPRDCDDSNAAHQSDCQLCADSDGDGYGPRCDKGDDCAPTDAAHWRDCGRCLDEDGDGYGGGCDLGGDCDDTNPNVWLACGACADLDQDGSYVGCDAFTTVDGPDCSDADAANWTSCETCVDADADNWYGKCDRYTTKAGPDCDDDDPTNWASCRDCRDLDGDGHFVECDSFSGRPAEDCDDGSAAHWADCGVCVDADGDGYGAGCDYGDDCDDLDEDNWSACDTCTDADADGRFTGCDGYTGTHDEDCDDTDADVWRQCESCVDLDGDGHMASCDQYTLVAGPDCNDGNARAWTTCTICADFDGDGRFANCDDYLEQPAADCDDSDVSNWVSCATCLDADGDNFYDGCDSYYDPVTLVGTVNGPDCAPDDERHWSDCMSCVDGDGDGRGSMCNMGEDCNESSAYHWQDCGLCVDGDADDYGAACDLGEDCADGDASTHPGASDVTIDGLDQNCDLFDGVTISDDFDDAARFDAAWESMSASLSASYSYSGAYSLRLDGYEEATTRALDTSACSTVFWEYSVRRYYPSGTLLVQYWDGSGWTQLDSFSGYAYDTSFSERRGTITDPTVLQSDLRLRVSYGDNWSGSFYIDDFRFGCDDNTDGDELIDHWDCAPSDAAHWTDCQTCPGNDSDGDDRGAGCDLGPDCAEGNVNAWSSCATCNDDDADTRYELCDDYTGILGPDCDDGDATVWVSCDTCADDDGDTHFAGCDAYPVSMDCDDTSELHWSDCLTCTTDSDDDGRGGATCDLGTDCDEGDARHWADCVACTAAIDTDDDGYGVGCDLGDDCGEGDAAVNPGMTDATIDGTDQNCDGIDGPHYRVDRFDTGATTLFTLSGDAAVTTSYRYSGTYSLNIAGGTGTATTEVFDSRACAAVAWSYMGKRGASAPGYSDYLMLSYFDGAAWITADTWYGNASTDSVFSRRQATITSAAARNATFQMRFTTYGSAALDDFFVDDFSFGCAEDGDGDGSIDVYDCSPENAQHWADCLVCSDSDGDGYGPSCDLGADCNTGDATVNPAATDSTVDGTDQNCDGFDGPVETFTQARSPALPVPYVGSYYSSCGGSLAASDALTVTQTGTIRDVEVTIDVTHPYVYYTDIFLELTTSGGTRCVTLSTQNGYSANFSGTTFDDEAASSITSGSPPFSGRFRPEGSLTSFDGQSLDGTWRLWVSDSYYSGGGVLNAWSLRVLYQ